MLESIEEKISFINIRVIIEENLLKINLNILLDN